MKDKAYLEGKRQMREIQNCKDMARFFKIKAILAETEEKEIEYLKKEDSFKWSYALLSS